MTGLDLIARLSNGDLLRPGHPLALAISIMCLCPAFSETERLGAGRVSEQLSVGDEPLSRSHVSVAIETLRIGAEGGSADSMVAAAHLYWISDESLADVDRQRGTAQAKGLESDFRELAAWWFPVLRLPQHTEVIAA
jgi:hypothetical protein